ncbi:XIAP ligase, partial [Oreotrochilus melanogaster]|nr:XIAP ligase [Oreotrochilus melanogaster]
MMCNGPENSAACAPPETDHGQQWAQEHYRLGTFVEFPLDCPVPASALARAGFVYTGEGDKVECFSCNINIEGWASGDCAMERHKNLSPHCRFIAESTSLENNTHPLTNSYQDEQHHENGSSNSALVDDPSELEADYLLRTRQVVDMSDTLYPKNPTMCSEETRLKSFYNWPLNGHLKPKELANAGFYYTGVEDQVACFCCGGKLKQWEPSDRAWSEHKRHFPKCFFVLGRDVGNVPSESELGRSGLNDPEYPRNPSMAKYGKRLQTFLTWIYPVDKEQLAEAGFYSTGNGDHVVCFHCGGGLQDWKENENPWDQHAKWFPGCRFVRKEKGQEFINNVHLRDECRDSTITEFPASIGLGNVMRWEGEAERGFHAAAWFFYLLKYFFFKLWPLNHLKKSLSLCVSIKKKNSVILSMLTSFMCLFSLDLSTEEKLRWLQEEKLCKICMAKDISIVFIPCGHLLACKECAELLNECPLCRSDIVRRQEVFMY